jgi:Protein of unknown function (DUF2877)
VSPRSVPCAASSLLTGLLDDSRARPLPLTEVARTRVSVHYDTGRDDVPVLCACTPDAVRLPASLVAPWLPDRVVTAHDGTLADGTTTWRVVRWWQPPRPQGLAPYALAPVPTVDRLEDLRPLDLVGLGPGLTPRGDDVVAGALVGASAVDHPRLADWRQETRTALRAHRTTAVSRGLLHHALEGYAIPALADFISAVCAGDADRESEALLAVGHSSGAALAAGALHALASHPAARSASCRAAA